MRLAPIALLFSSAVWIAPGVCALTPHQTPVQHSTQLHSAHVLNAWTHEWQEWVDTSDSCNGCPPASCDNSTGRCPGNFTYVKKAESHTDIQVGTVVYESDRVHKQVQVGGEYRVNIKSDRQGRAKTLTLVVGSKSYTYSIKRTRPDAGTTEELRPEVATKKAWFGTVTEADSETDRSSEIQIQDIPTGPIQITDLHAFLSRESAGFLDVSYKLKNCGQKKISAFTIRFSNSTESMEYSVPKTIEPGASVERKESLCRYDDTLHLGKHKFVVVAVGFADGTIWNR